MVRGVKGWKGRDLPGGGRGLAAQPTEGPDPVQLEAEAALGGGRGWAGAGPAWLGGCREGAGGGGGGGWGAAGEGRGGWVPAALGVER